MPGKCWAFFYTKNEEALTFDLKRSTVQNEKHFLILRILAGNMQYNGLKNR
jgi:hypothetical protein